MSGYLNRVQLIGNLGRDPEVRQTQTGQRIVSLNIATSERWKDQRSGEARERTEWHRVIIWNEGLGEIAERYLTKGAKVFLEGKLVTRKWQDQDGKDRYSTEIHIAPYNGVLTFLDTRRHTEQASARNDETPNAGRSAPTWEAPKDRDLDDEIPF